MEGLLNNELSVYFYTPRKFLLRPPYPFSPKDPFMKNRIFYIVSITAVTLFGVLLEKKIQTEMFERKVRREL
jgi:hypothetical protein